MKKTNSSTKKVIAKSKLKQYSALAASVVALDASAQVVYTNINDTTLVNNGDYFDIDLNNDGVREGRIEFIDYTSTYYGGLITIDVKGAEVDSLFNASVNVENSVFGTTTTSTSSTYVAAALNLNTNINNSLNTWSSGSASSTTTSTYSSAFNGVLIGAKVDVVAPGGTYTNNLGQFPGSGDKFLGVRFTIGPATHYGWVRLDMSANSDSITIRDFAYNATPNAPILAGDTGSAVGLAKQDLKNKLDYFASNGQIIINSELSSRSTLTIFDLSGKLIQSQEIGNQKEISIQEKLEGVFVVEIRNATGVTRKKLWLSTH